MIVVEILGGLIIAALFILLIGMIGFFAWEIFSDWGGEIIDHFKDKKRDRLQARADQKRIEARERDPEYIRVKEYEAEQKRKREERLDWELNFVRTLSGPERDRAVKAAGAHYGAKYGQELGIIHPGKYFECKKCKDYERWS